MAFDGEQLRALSAKLSARHVRCRLATNGMTLSYIEGWHAIAEANRIFGYDAWDRQTMTLKCVWSGRRGDFEACSYIARVRVRVRTGEIVICREGCGSGHGKAMSPGEAHESAIKEAETDAMKRALATFGNPFGLALYDREKRGVTGRGRKVGHASYAKATTWVVLKSNGQVHSKHHHPGGFYTALRELLERTASKEELKILWERNWAVIRMLKENFPTLISDHRKHYSDILILLYRRRLEDFEDHKEEKTQKKPNGAEEPEGTVLREGSRKIAASQIPVKARIDKSALKLDAPRRLRDKAYLRYVASQPCVVCGKRPCQAHHLRFAQPRALGRKVSDEWTVPLCIDHHAELHQAGNERAWWRERVIDPLGIARELRSKKAGSEPGNAGGPS